ncbi:hypothetical protein FVEN_g12712 [Fusarium venenatum]|uniref:Uncharacterized protein n=1 Tax=Fusarium venenatum TaxID=56646 RepID=A0A2L2TQQ0_9HYPO|nr:uncharacterized protein FVRRES_06341 [Fusarium venenatum]KAG8359481.1 hypothetical protein FVEN_g12712 [Fusarium venenatum]KAH6993343.1 hypothetical protein EDB82DRAFT_499009 [Fusarium venenatum]CEI61905.1 unnamed protein product [Fusarium venenatum]
MLVHSVFSTAALCALVSSVVATSHGLPKRPHIEAAPYGTGNAFPKSSPRSRKDICYVKPGKGKNSDDAPANLSIFSHLSRASMNRNTVLKVE